MSQICFLTIMALTLLTLTNCNPLENQTEENQTYYSIFGILRVNKHSSLRLCGRALAEALSIACGHNGYNKRSSGFYYQLAKNDLTQGPSNEIDLTKSLIQSLIHKRSGKFNRKIRGAHDECCENTCNFSTLESYCVRSTTQTPTLNSSI